MNVSSDSSADGSSISSGSSTSSETRARMELIINSEDEALVQKWLDREKERRARSSKETRENKKRAGDVADARAKGKPKGEEKPKTADEKEETKP